MVESDFDVTEDDIMLDTSTLGELQPGPSGGPSSPPSGEFSRCSESETESDSFSDNTESLNFIQVKIHILVKNPNYGEKS